MNTMHLLEAMTNIDAAIIENAQPQRRPAGKSVARIVLLAALIAVLTMTAFATVEAVNWFKNYFAQRSGENLTPNQITFIEENTTDLTQSQTCNGYTITIESAISDGTNGFIKLKLTAPEGVTLDALNYFPGNDDTLTTFEEGTGETTTWGMGWGKVEDNDGLDNTVGILCRMHGFVKNRTQWKLRIEDIHGTYEENPGEANYRQWTELIAEGIWEFDVAFSDTGNEEIELITEPVEGEVNIALNKESYKKVKITSLKLRAMSAEITYEFLEPTHASGEFDEIIVVMKDGTQVLMLPRSGHQGYCGYEFAVPIILSDVDHVLLPDGTKLAIP